MKRTIDLQTILDGHTTVDAARIIDGHTRPVGHVVDARHPTPRLIVEIVLRAAA